MYVLVNIAGGTAVLIRLGSFSHGTIIFIYLGQQTQLVSLLTALESAVVAYQKIIIVPLD